MPNKIAGKASYISISGVKIPITKATKKTSRTLADSTDSDDYDPNTDMIYKSQVPVDLSDEITVEGHYNVAKIPTNVVQKLYSGGGPYAVVFGLDSGNLAGHGNFDISGFECSAPRDGMVGYSLTLMSNGIFTPLA